MARTKEDCHLPHPIDLPIKLSARVCPLYGCLLFCHVYIRFVHAAVSPPECPEAISEYTDRFYEIRSATPRMLSYSANSA